MVERVKRALIFNFSCKNFTMGLLLGVGFGFLTNEITMGIIAGVLLGLFLGRNGTCY